MFNCKHALNIFIFISSTQITFAQTQKGIGIRAGANISRLANSNLDAKINSYFGLFYHARISDLYALQPEVGYSNQGGKIKGSNNVYIEYITLNVANKFYLNPENGFHVLISAGADLDIDDRALRNTFDGNDVTFIDLHIALGIGYELKNGLNFEIRYKQGLIDVYSGSFHNFDSDLYENKIQLNSVFQIGMSYKLNLTKKNN